PLSYVGAMLAACAVTTTRPAQGALLPTLVDSPRELTAANVASGWMESISLLAGPALAVGLIALAGPGAALSAFAGLALGSAVLVAPLSACGAVPPVGDEEPARAVARGVMSLLRSDRAVGPVLAVGATQFIAIGALDVLEVVLAVKVLGMGGAGAGYLGAAFGFGAIAGGIA